MRHGEVLVSIHDTFGGCFKSPLRTTSKLMDLCGRWENMKLYPLDLSEEHLALSWERCISAIIYMNTCVCGEQASGLVFITKLCWILRDPRNCSPPGSSVPGVFQQEYWSGLPFPSGGESSRSRDQTPVSCTDKWILYHWAVREARMNTYIDTFSSVKFEMLSWHERQMPILYLVLAQDAVCVLFHWMPKLCEADGISSPIL